MDDDDNDDDSLSYIFLALPDFNEGNVAQISGISPHY